MRKTYHTDLSDSEWAPIEPHLPAPKAPGRHLDHQDMATGALVGEIRATTVDLLMSTGLERDEVLRELEEMARYDEEQG